MVVDHQQHPSLFAHARESFVYQPDAIVFEQEATSCLRPLVEQFLFQGYSPRELALLLIHVALDFEQESLLLHRKERGLL